MKASELMGHLSRCIEVHGDLDVHVQGDDEWPAVLDVQVSGQHAIDVTGEATPFLVIDIEWP